jgi:hypothetical protein
VSHRRARASLPLMGTRWSWRPAAGAAVGRPTPSMAAGAAIASSSDAVWSCALVVKVKELQPAEFRHLVAGTTVHRLCPTQSRSGAARCRYGRADSGDRVRDRAGRGGRFAAARADVADCGPPGAVRGGAGARDGSRRRRRPVAGGRRSSGCSRGGRWRRQCRRRSRARRRAHGCPRHGLFPRCRAARRARHGVDGRGSSDRGVRPRGSCGRALRRRGCGSRSRVSAACSSPERCRRS